MSDSNRHPFLLVGEEEYRALRQRVEHEPWATWAERAAEQVDAELAGETPREHCEAIIAKASGAALTHVLDEERRGETVAAVLAAVDHYDERITPELGNPAADNQWHFVVPPSGALFTLVLALDVIAPDADPDALADAEARIARAADWFHEEQYGAWKAARYGAYGAWAVYEGDAERIEEAAERTLEAFETEWSDGVYREGCEYANQRFAGHDIRNAKVHFPDVLDAAAGVDFYDDEAVRRDFAWLFGYGLSPVVYGGERDTYTFGDSGPRHTITSRSSCAYRAAKFGGDVENNAAWAITADFDDRNVFATYALTEHVPADPDPPGSRVFDGGGAWLLSDAADPESLAGVLWSPTDASGHSHPDANAVHLCAYGEHVLRNAGYAGWGNGREGFGWEYVHDRAVANNVVLVDYEFDDDRNPPEDDGHVARSGGGITEALIGGGVEYACADSGGALGEATHRRSLLAVHPGATDGYWVLFDEVEAPDADTVHTALHPGTGTDPGEVVPGQEYLATVDRAPRSDNDVSLSVVYGTQPSSVSVREGLLADWEDSFVGQYLYATYAGDGQVVTVLSPHEGDPAVDTHRIGAAGYTGTRVDHGGSVDRAVEVSGDEASVGPASVAGRAALFREREGVPGFYFVRRGTRFSHGDRGFEADDPVSVLVEDGTGGVVADRATTVRFDHPGAGTVRVDGTDVTRTGGDGRVEATITPGRHRLELE